MSAESVVVLVLTAAALVPLAWIEVRSRRNAQSAETNPEAEAVEVIPLPQQKKGRTRKR